MSGDEKKSPPPGSEATVFVPATGVRFPTSGPAGSAPGAQGGNHRPVQVGDVLNHMFEVKRFIARGGMGEVFEGINVASDERVAIKVMLSSLSADEKLVALFRKEARTLTRLNHPALVQYRVLAQEPQLGVFYIVTEFVDGKNLSEVINQLDPTLPDLIDLTRRLASGLDAAHALGAIHRDMSPDNVMLEGGRLSGARIIDFGIAKDLNAGPATIIGDGFAGKLNYVAPEQLGDFNREVGPWTDIYSLGLIILAVAARRDVDMGGTLVNAVDKRRAGPDLSSAPEELRPLLARMLKPNPAERLRSMGELLGLLAEVESGTHRPTIPPAFVPEATEDPPVEPVADEVAADAPADEPIPVDPPLPDEPVTMEATSFAPVEPLAEEAGPDTPDQPATWDAVDEEATTPPASEPLSWAPPAETPEPPATELPEPELSEPELSEPEQIEPVEPAEPLTVETVPPAAIQPPLAPPRPDPAHAGQPGKNRLPLVLGGVAAVALLAIAGWAFLPSGKGGDATLQSDSAALANAAQDDPGAIRAALVASLPSVSCTWLDVVDVSRKGGGTVAALRGVAGKPDEAQAQITGALAARNLKATSIDFREVASIDSSECAPLDALRQIRDPAGNYMTMQQRQIEMSKQATGSYAGSIAATAITEFTLPASDQELALFGIEPSGKISQLLSGRSQLVDASEAVGGNRYNLSVDVNHTGWSGFLLLSGQDLSGAGLLAGAPGSRTGDWSQRFLTAAREHGWKAEMAWFNTVDLQPN